MAETKDTDINKFMWPYYDPSLLLKILDFYQKEKVYDAKTILNQRVKVLSCTKMDTALRNTFKELHGNTNYPPGKLSSHCRIR
jgi:hypothetical protein